MSKTDLRLRRYKQSKIARKLGFRGREVNRKIPDPDLDRARTPRRRRYCSPATTGKEAAAGDEGTGGRGGGCRGGAGVEAGGAPPGTARRRRLLRPGRRGAGGGVGRGGPARRRTAAGQRPEEEKKGGGARAPLARAVGGEGRPRALAGRRCGRGRGGRRATWRLAAGWARRRTLSGSPGHVRWRRIWRGDVFFKTRV